MNSKIELTTKRRIVAYLGKNRDLILMVKAKIYSSDKNADHWVFSGLQGILCFVTDYHAKSMFIVMYSVNNYEKLFEIELYLNFKNYYTVLSEVFHCFEYCDGFIGLEFSDKEMASTFKVIVDKFDDKLISFLMSGGQVKNQNYKDLVKRNIQICKDKFSNVNQKYDEDYIEDKFININKPRYFELLGNISYNREKNIFDIMEKDTQSVLKNAGIKKNQMKDTEFALEIFKKMIETLAVIETIGQNYNVHRSHYYPNNKNIGGTSRMSGTNITDTGRSSIKNKGK